MADWTDLVGLTIEQARERAQRYDHDVVAIFIDETAVHPKRDATRAAVQVTLNESGPRAIVIAQHGIEHPDVAPQRERTL